MLRAMATCWPMRRADISRSNGLVWRSRPIGQTAPIALWPRRIMAATWSRLTLRAVDQNIAFTAVRASRGKVTRAEPASSLYEQGRIHHVGTFSQLEDQMT